MSWTNKAVLAWGWILTPEEIASLPEEVYEEWLDKEWLIYSEGMDEEIFTYFSVDADESPKNMTNLSEINEKEIDKGLKLFIKLFQPALMKAKLICGMFCVKERRNKWKHL